MNSIFSRETEISRNDISILSHFPSILPSIFFTVASLVNFDIRLMVARFSKFAGGKCLYCINGVKSISKYYVEDFSMDDTQSSMNNNNNLLVEWKDSRWLVLSSALFGLPSIYGFQKSAVLHSTLLVVTSGVSMGYWVCAKHSWRRNLDICLAKASAVIFVVSGIYNIRTVYVCMFYPGCIGFLYMYYLSAKYYRKNPLWISYHFIFHLIIAMETSLIFLHI